MRNNGYYSGVRRRLHPRDTGRDLRCVREGVRQSQKRPHIGIVTSGLFRQRGLKPAWLRHSFLRYQTVQVLPDGAAATARKAHATALASLQLEYVVGVQPLERRSRPAARHWFGLVEAHPPTQATPVSVDVPSRRVGCSFRPRPFHTPAAAADRLAVHSGSVRRSPAPGAGCASSRECVMSRSRALDSRPRSGETRAAGS